VPAAATIDLELAEGAEPAAGHVRRNWLFAVGATIVAVSLVLAAIGPLIAPYNPEAPSSAILVPPPSLTELPGLAWSSLTGGQGEPVHWLGTDAAGLDVFSRVIAAPRVDVVIALAATAISLALGSLLGLVAGYYRNGFTDAITRASDLLQAFPVFILAMIFVAVSGRNQVSLVLTLGLLYAPIFLRLTRSRVVSERTRAYVEAERAIGHPELSIAVRHVLPNSIAPALVQATVTMGWAILLTAGLSFIGAGVRPPTPEWGGMIAAGAEQIVNGRWWLSVFPGIAISITVFGYAAVGNVLQERHGRRGR
jgi:peptide/nickel transport system permease protein